MMEAVLGLIGAVLGVIAALIGRKKIIEHRVGVAATGPRNKGRGKRIVFFILLVMLAMFLIAITEDAGAPEELKGFIGFIFLVGTGGALYQITRWFFD